MLASRAMTVAERFAGTPCNRLLGLTLRSCSPQRVEVEMPARAEFAQQEGVVQGGVLTALADAAAVHVVWPFLPADRAMTGTTCTMHFLDAARPGGAPLRAVATPVRIGKTISVCETVITQDDRVVAKGTFTLLVRERRAP